jgi:hypothetical protein
MPGLCADDNNIVRVLKNQPAAGSMLQENKVNKI